MTEREWLNEFSVNLARMMYEYRLTQREVSELSGIPEGTISKYLNRKQMPGIKSIINISYVFSCSVSDLIDFGVPIKN